MIRKLGMLSKVPIARAYCSKFFNINTEKSSPEPKSHTIRHLTKVVILLAIYLTLPVHFSHLIIFFNTLVRITSLITMKFRVYF